jgi:iron-sulfur cluster repair protein YtfE (RIC family)
MIASSKAIEVDHIRLASEVARLHERISQLAAHTGSQDARDDLVAVIVHLMEQLFAHFAREEEVLFPYLTTAGLLVPSQLAQMLSAHDRICGAAARIHSLAVAGKLSQADVGLVQSLFERFETEFTAHSKFEGEFLGNVAKTLDSVHEAHLAALLAEHQ